MSRPISEYGVLIGVLVLVGVITAVMFLTPKGLKPQAEPEPLAEAKRPVVTPAETEPETVATPEVTAKPEPSPPPVGETETQLTSLLGRALTPLPAGPKRTELEGKLNSARAELAKDPDNPEKMVWVGRWLGYLWQMEEAIEVYGQGIEKHPEYAPFYRHRGHRYISIRQFDKAIDDLERATLLIEGYGPEVEQDGKPNARNIPLTTTGFNVWYHLGLAYYLKGDYNSASNAWIETLKHCGDYDDNMIAVCAWLYMNYRRAGDERAAAITMAIRPGMDVIENHGYFRCLRMYQGAHTPEELLGTEFSESEQLIQRYAIANKYLTDGESDKARALFEQVVQGKQWPAFAFIASEVELAKK